MDHELRLFVAETKTKYFYLIIHLLQPSDYFQWHHNLFQSRKLLSESVPVYVATGLKAEFQTGSPGASVLFEHLNYSQPRLHFVRNANRQTRVFEVFNVKFKLLHDSSSYQTVRRQLLLLVLFIANAISS